MQYLLQIYKKIFKNYNFHIIIGILILLIFFFKEILFNNKSFVGYADINYQLIPYKTFISKTIVEDKSFPLWTPYIFFGFPIFAESQGGVLYPINFVLYLLPVYKQINYNIIIHFFLAGIFMLLFLNIISQNKLINFLGIILWMFSGLFINRIDHLNVLDSFVYIPLFFYIVEKYIKKESIIYLYLLSLITFINILAGHLQATFYIFIILFIYYLLRLFDENKINFKKISLLIIFFGWGILLAAIQILPLYELVNFSVRKGGMATHDILFSQRLHWVNIFNIVFPYILGSTHNNTYIGYFLLHLWYLDCLDIYMGVIIIFIFIFAIKKIVNDKDIRRYLLFILLIFLFSLGGNFLLNYIIVKIPGISFFRNPERIIFFYVFFVSILTVNVLSKLKREDISLKFFKILIFVGIFIIIGDLFFIVMKGVIIDKINIKNILINKIMSTKYHHYEFNYYYNKLFRTLNFILYHILQQSIFFIILSFSFILYKIEKINKKKLIIIIIFITIMELFVNLKNYPKIIDNNYFKYIPQTVQFLKKQEKNKYYRILQWRFFENESIIFKNGKSLGTLEEFLLDKEILQPNKNMEYEIMSYWGYNPLGYKKYYTFFKDIDRGSLIGGEKSIKYLKKGFETLNVSGVKYVLTPFLIKDDRLKFITKINYVNIYKNKDFIPLINFVTKAYHIIDENKILNIIKNRKINLKDNVLIKSDKNFTENLNKENNNYKIFIKKWKNNIIEFALKTNTSGYIVISNSFYPGWIAYVNGKKTKIYNANYLFQAIKVNSGYNNIILIYKPLSFKIGMIISIVTFIIFFIFFLKKIKINIRESNIDKN